MSQPKYHHLIPRTYLKPWCYKNDGVYNFNKETKKLEHKNIKNNYGMKDFHSLKFGMPALAESDMGEIADFLSNYDIYLDEEKLENIYDYREKYYKFNQWKILDKGKKISKRDLNILKSTIENKKILDIERDWNYKYENKWDKIRSDLIFKILSSNSPYIHSVNKGFLMKFIIAMDWRGFCGNEEFEKVFNFLSKNFSLDEISIPKKERTKNYLETASEEMKNNLLLKKYREFLNDEGIIYNIAKNYIRLMTIKFYVANCKLEFITSDNPSFITKNFEGKQVHVMPIAPRILASIGLNDNKSDVYYIEYLDDYGVKEINNHIYDKAKTNIIISEVTKTEWINKGKIHS